MKKNHQVTLSICALAMVASLTAKANLGLLSYPNDQLMTIPAGSYTMGDSNDGLPDAPVHTVVLGAFQMDKCLITYSNWVPVYNYAVNHGYNFSTNGWAFPGTDQPINSVSWFDAVKWCNARTESENNGGTPVYYTNASCSADSVYRTGNFLVYMKTNLDGSIVDGYRLPTEAEWEIAARGKLVGNRFPWGMTTTHSYANYSTPSSAPFFDLGPLSVSSLATVAVTRYYTNGYGLYGMAGNLYEWCWDIYSATYYITGPRNNPTGPTSLSITGSRVERGGTFRLGAAAMRTACRAMSAPAGRSFMTGFRCVRSGTGVTAQAQTIQFDSSNNPTTVTAGTSITLTATSSSGQTVNFSTSGSAQVANLSTDGSVTNLNAIAAGTFTVTASVPGGSVNGTLYAATSTSFTFQILGDPKALVANLGTQLFQLTGTNYVVLTYPPLSNPTANMLNAISNLYVLYFSSTPAGQVSSKMLSQTLGTNIVDQAGLNTVLAHYWSQSPPCITNATFPGRTNLSFTITNFAFTVQCSTNMSTWQDLHTPAKIVFDDTNALGALNRYYRLVGTTNYPY